MVSFYTAEPFSPGDPPFNVPFDPNFSFGSEAANLEYSILSAILGNPSPPESGTEAQSPQIQYLPSVPSSAWSPDSLSQAQYNQSPMLGSNGYGSSYAEQQSSLMRPSDTMSASQISPPFMDFPSMPQYQVSPQEQSGNQQQTQYARPYAQQQQPQQPTVLHPLEPRFPREFHTSPTSASGPSAFGRSSSRDSIILGSPSASSSSTPVHTAYADGTESRGSQLQRINARVTRPFDYTEGYHFLMKHLQTRCVPARYL